MRDNRAAYWRRWMTGASGGEQPPLVAPPRRQSRPDRHFTVHLGFTAADLVTAREVAVGYAEALSVLRPELAIGASALSPADAWQRAERLFCGALGPDGERCVDVADHCGFHHGPGPGGLGWGDGDRG
ncbi:hypothetical protein ACFFMR_12120 [Micromonospora andamanensis]|uniref:Uncharacterized protein n=1 Tax=Micromonospora andamanensis TaxID=1287068 RepID=A0ABQ4HTV1_9ACTN|nr:hypothetical protein [Micromonospora andamanensis]GIJ09061.1 hypothetical protein Van01_22750 [Micromonospora andamanensis]